MSTVSYVCCRITHIHFSLLPPRKRFSLEIHEILSSIKQIFLKLISKNTKSHTIKYETVSSSPCFNYPSAFFRDIICYGAVGIDLKIFSFDVSFDVHLPHSFRLPF